jgi:phospholipid/cholesterol/gamma-HCH transport system substrate-binding protein
VELNKALEGRENRVKDLLGELDTFIGGLDKQRKEIVRALKGIDRLAKRLAAEKTTIAQAVDTVPGALKVLADQRRDLTAMLTSLSELGKTGTKVINTSRADTVANLKSLQPILQQLNKAGSDLPNSLELLTTYPFPRNVTGAIKGDYVNLKITADLDLASVYGNLAEEPPGPGPEEPELPEVPGTPDLPGVPGLPKAPLPTAPPEVPGAPTPGVPPPSGGDGPLCPPVCTGSQVAHGDGDGRRLPAGIDLALAELMLKGMQP